MPQAFQQKPLLYILLLLSVFLSFIIYIYPLDGDMYIQKHRHLASGVQFIRTFENLDCTQSSMLMPSYFFFFFFFCLFMKNKISKMSQLRKPVSARHTSLYLVSSHLF